MRETVDKIYTALSTNATLTAYVNMFSKGGISRARLQWPFVNIGTIEDVPIEKTTIGPTGKGNTSNFYCMVEFGCKHTLPEMAYFGDATTKGILHLADDLREICTDNLFDNAFLFPSTVERVMVTYIDDPAGWIWVGELTIKGRRRETRTVKC
jgi:hypothetical protein